MLANVSVHMVEHDRALKNGCSKYLFHKGELPIASCLQEILQDQQVGVTQVPFKLLLLALGPEACEILCAL